MSRPFRLGLCVTLVASLCVGCSTIESLSSDDPSTPKIYGGVRLHLRGQSEADASSKQLGGKIVSAITDLPLSAILDTLLLPVTVFLEPASPEERMEQNERQKEKEREEEWERRRKQREQDRENRGTEWSGRVPRSSLA